MSAPSLIVLENIAAAPRRPLTVHLEHDVYCGPAGDCRCDRRKAGSSTFDPSQQKRVYSEVNVRLAYAVTLNAAGTPGSMSEPLHPAVLQTKDAQRLLKSRAIRAKPAPAEAPEPPAPPPPAVEPAPEPTPARPVEPVVRKSGGKSGGTPPSPVTG